MKGIGQKKKKKKKKRKRMKNKRINKSVINYTVKQEKKGYRFLRKKSMNNERKYKS